MRHGRLALAFVLGVAGCGRFDFDATGDGTTAPGAAPTFDATSNAAADSASGLGWVHTVSGADPAVFVFVATRQSTVNPPTVVSVELDSVPFTKIISLCPDCGPAINNYELWYLLAPPLGSHALAVTLTGEADGTSAVAVSYDGVSARTIDQTASASATTQAPALSWTESADAVWSVAGAMNQGGFAMFLVPADGQAEHTPTSCDSDHYEGASAADQLANATTAVDYVWMIGGGPNNPACDNTVTNHTWITLGASFR